MHTRRMFAAGSALIAWGLASGYVPAAEPDVKPAAKVTPAAEASSKETREREFQESLSGVELNGHFTINGQESPKKEKYTIQNVSKLNDTVWIFNARIQYGDKDVTVPVPMKVEWAGDTPVASMTDMPVPGLGTFTARVIFFRNRYAGTWQHGPETGGHLFGTYAKPAAPPKAE